MELETEKKETRIDHILNRICIEMLKSMILVAIGYAWAVKAYGVFH